jgi:lipoate-protein ligase A
MACLPPRNTLLTLASSWRLLVTEPTSGADNMALDHALMRRALRTREGVIRIYGWSRPTVSFGRNEAAIGRYAGYEAVRRPTGGRAILHHRELTYSFTLPEIERPRALYAHLNSLLAAALSQLGVPVTIVERRAAASSGPCFAVPATGEMTYDGRKIAGSAQWRENGAVLQHGSILVDDDQQAIGAGDNATLREALGRAPSLYDLADAFGRVAETKPLGMEPQLGKDSDELRRHYADVAWTWRK